MYDEIKKMESKIRFLEDKLLRSKNYYEIEQLQSDLMHLRTRLQKMKWDNQKKGAYY